jgi:hypothetical protein
MSNPRPHRPRIRPELRPGEGLGHVEPPVPWTARISRDTVRESARSFAKARASLAARTSTPFGAPGADGVDAVPWTARIRPRWPRRRSVSNRQRVTGRNTSPV